MSNATFSSTSSTSSTPPADRSNRWLGFVIAGLAVGMTAAIPAWPQNKPATPPAPAEEPPPVFTVEPGFKYDTRGRVDPFVNPTPPPAPAVAPRGNTPAPVQPGVAAPPPPPEIIIPFSRPRGLKGLMLEDVSLKGIVVGKDPAMTMAIIQGPGNRTYNVTRKDEIFNAVIKDIRIDAVVFSPIVRRDDAGAPLTVREVRPDSVLYTKLPRNVRPEPMARDVVRKLHPAPGEPK